VENCSPTVRVGSCVVERVGTMTNTQRLFTSEAARGSRFFNLCGECLLAEICSLADHTLGKLAKFFPC